MNEPPVRASQPVMDPLSRIELLLTRAHDGLASEKDLSDLAALGAAVGLDVEAELEALATLRRELQAACDEPVDVADDVLSFLEEPAWADELRGALRAPVDVADDVLAALDDLPAMELARFGDGEVPDAERAAVSGRLLRDAGARAALSAQAELGAAVRDAVAEAEPVDVWDDVARAIGAEPDRLAPWESVADELRGALATVPAADVADAVMARLDPPARAASRWPRAIFAGAGVAALAAAAILVSVVVGTASGPGRLAANLGPSTAVGDLVLSAINDARVEEIRTPGDVVAQVVQFEEGGPTFILFDDPDGIHDGGAAL